MAEEQTQSTETQTPAPAASEGTTPPAGQEPSGGRADDKLSGVQFDDGEELETPSDDIQTAGTVPEDQQIPPETPAAKEINQEAVDKKINKLTFEKHEEIRKREEVEKTLKEAQERLAKLEGKGQVVEVPPMPDPTDIDYDQKLVAREEAIAANAKLEAQRETAKQAQEEAYQKQIEANAAEVQKHVETMYSGAKDLGVKEDELKEADARVARFINDPELAKFIISQPDSALLVKHLASSANDLTKISQMNPIQATAYLVTTVIPAAAKLKPGVTKTPPPIDVPSGKGGGESQSPFLTGVILE